jgi:hypothetical protein
MKKSLPYEIAATLLALLGVFLLVGLYMPMLNPEQTRIETHRELPAIGFYVVMTPIPLFVLMAAWHFNRTARALKQGEGSSVFLLESALEKRLKWIFAAVVIVLVLIAFLW